MSKSRSGAPRRVAVGLLAGALSVVGIALAPTAGAVDDVSGDRIAGINRYATAAAVAGQDDFDAATTAILATGETFPDALAASGLAGANAPAPIILTQSDTYSDEAQEALNNLTSITDVIIVGGTAAVSQDVQDAVEDDGFTVSRVAGTNRFETAADIAGEIGTVGQVGGLDTAFIATGTGFADALAGGPLAYALGSPILLVTPNEIPAATSAAIDDLGIEQVVILGGTAAVSDDVAGELEDATGNAAIRVAGENRFGTAAAVGEFAVDELGWAPTEVLLASGLNFPDALSGGPLGGERNAPIILTASLPQESEDFLDDHSDTIEDVTALGGTGVIDEETLDDAETAAEDTDNDTPSTPTNATATNRPELVTAQIVETRVAAAATASRPSGTYVKYCFDEPITGAAITATLFHLYSADGTRFTGTGTETSSTGQTFTSSVTSTDNKCAEVIFGGPGVGAAGTGTLDTAAEAASLTLATNEEGAAAGSSYSALSTVDTSIEGDAPLTPTGSTTATSGVTSAPDLVSVGNFRAGATADLTAVDFTFDQAAFNTNTRGYHLVRTSGALITCTGPATGSAATPSGLASPGGEGTTVHTVSCEEPAGFPGNFAATDIARGFVDAATVSTVSGGPTNANPLQAADVTGAGTDANPDLTLVIFAPDAVVGTDAVAYVYDEAVTSTVTAGGHGIYTSAGVENRAASCGRSGDNNAVVTCLFADNTLSGATYVGGNVRAGTVTAADDAGANAADEVGATPSSGATASSGLTDGPDLTGVAINTTVNAFGNTVYSATYTFDEDVADTASAVLVTDNAAAGNSATGENVILALLHLYTADGIRLDCSTLSGLGTAQDTATLTARDENLDNTVTCVGYAVGGATGGANVAAPAATGAQIASSVVGSVEYGAVDDEAVGGDTNPEGAAVTSGSTGTPV